MTDPLTWQKFKPDWEAGAKEAGKNTTEMPVLIEQFVVVGDKSDAAKAAGLWRFLPKAFKTYYKMADPAAIEQRAGEELPLEKGIRRLVHRDRSGDPYCCAAEAVR